MALPLLESSPTFKRSILQCAAALQPVGIDLMAEFKAEQGWQAPKLAMVGLVAVQIGLVDLLREEHGITPAGMLGHSAGMCFSCKGCL
jgi:fatty acid synthase, animal type